MSKAELKQIQIIYFIQDNLELEPDHWLHQLPQKMEGED